MQCQALGFQNSHVHVNILTFGIIITCCYIAATVQIGLYFPLVFLHEFIYQLPPATRKALGGQGGH